MASTSSRDPATAVTGGTESTLVVELIRAFTTPVGSSSIQMRRTSTPVRSAWKRAMSPSWNQSRHRIVTALASSP